MPIGTGAKFPFLYPATTYAVHRVPTFVDGTFHVLWFFAASRKVQKLYMN